MAITSCLWYCKDIHLEANHNQVWRIHRAKAVAYDIAKIYIWKQITTTDNAISLDSVLLMILQRYTFGSKSQHSVGHRLFKSVAYDIAKIYIWKQITTCCILRIFLLLLLMILQRYTFGSKSQRVLILWANCSRCLWYCKDIHLEANHNRPRYGDSQALVAYDIAKIYIWKQITTQVGVIACFLCCLWYCKDIHLEANHNDIWCLFLAL